MESNKPIRCAAYCRVSTVGLGQDANLQLATIQEFARHRGFEIVESYLDQGVSGSHESRPAFDRLRKDAQRGKFQVILTVALDRIARSTLHMLRFLEEMRHYNVKLISLRESLDFTTPQGEMILTVLAAVGALEKAIISERIRNSMRAKKMIAEQTGIPWRCGRTPITKDLKIQVIELRGRGLSLRAIEKALDKKVSRASIANILRENTATEPCPKTSKPGAS